MNREIRSAASRQIAAPLPNPERCKANGQGCCKIDPPPQIDSMSPAKESRHILVVDDSATIRAAVTDYLTQADFEVETAEDGESALESIQKRLPALILLDVLMPGIDGFETCRQLKKHPATSRIPVIFMTGLSNVSDRVTGLNVGAVDYIIKPFQEEEMLARVKVHFNLRTLTRTLEQQNTFFKDLTKRLEQRVSERTVKIARSLDELQQTQLQVIQNEKMRSLGHLLAGVSHEINNPANSIAANLSYAVDYVQEINQILQLYRQHYPAPHEDIQAALDGADLDFSLADLDKIMVSMKYGTDRLCDLSQSLRTFSRMDTTEKRPVNIHEGIDSTLLILQHRLRARGDRGKIEVVKDYDNLPIVKCYPAELNQVFMNLLANAIDALEEHDPPRAITIRTTMQANSEEAPAQVNIHIIDNGPGLSEGVQAHLFDPMFTTKPPGKGTGLGLSIVRQIVEDRHQGKILCHSTLGQGAEFIVQLPLS